MEEIYVNAEFAKCDKTSTNHTGPRSSKKSFYLGVIVFLGLLSVFLLTGLITLGVYYSAADLFDMSNKLGSMTEERDLLNANLSTMSKKVSSMTEERDLLHANLTEKTKELERLQYLSKQKKTCPPNVSHCSCYLLSERSDTWEVGRNDCSAKGADLVVIDSAEEQKFLTTLIRKETWIGLNDEEEEGRWKWTDGTPVNVTYWADHQPDNGGGDPKWGEEDCAYIRTYLASWNDFSCGASLQWICEKLP